jgi:WD40 repeat protein
MINHWKTVRVFISSTFRDMQSERDYLIGSVLPELRADLQKHHIHLRDIDLRWGVTKEQAENNNVLELLLNQIDTCDFFIGMVGGRYGFVPNLIHARVLAAHPWLRDCRGRSLTELEMRYGALNPTRPRHSCVLSRDAGFIQGLPPFLAAQFVDADPQAQANLARLMEDIRNAGLLRGYSCTFAGVRLSLDLAGRTLSEEDWRLLFKTAPDGLIRVPGLLALPRHLREYALSKGSLQLTGMEEFGNRVREELRRGMRQFLDQRRSSTTASDDVTEADYHEQFAESRTEVYAGRNRYHEALAAFVNDPRQSIFLLEGSSGVGKSAVMANFSRRFAETRPSRTPFVIPHFVGISDDSTGLRAILRRFCTELNGRFDFEDEVPESTDSLVVVFREMLLNSPADTPLVLIIDALDLLDDEENARALYWLPTDTHEHVKIILSINSRVPADDTLRSALRRLNPTGMVLEELSPAERIAVIESVPALSAKSLDDLQKTLLARNSETGNPLYLTVALEELRGLGIFEDLDASIQGLPEGADAAQRLFDSVIRRLERGFGASLVACVLNSLAWARRGLTADELKVLSAESGTPSELFALLRQLRPYLLERASGYGFFHSEFRDAILSHYPAEIQSRWLKRLTSYHEVTPTWLNVAGGVRVNQRKVEELVGLQLEYARQTGEYSELIRLLTDLDFLEAQVQAGLLFEIPIELSSARELIGPSHPDHVVLSLLEEAIRREINYVHAAPDALFQVLWNRLWWQDSPEARTRSLAYQDDPPMADAEVAQPLPLRNLVEDWHAKKIQRDPTFFWLRSLTPPAVPLGVAESACYWGHLYGVTCLAFSCDGRYFASGSVDGTVVIWNATTGEVIGSTKDFWNHYGNPMERLADQKAIVTGVAFSPDGSRVAYCRNDGAVLVASAMGHLPAKELASEGCTSRQAVFTAHGTEIVAGFDDGSLRTWNAEDGAALATLPGQGGPLTSITAPPDGRYFALADERGNLTFFDASTVRPTHSVGVTSGIESLACSQDGRYVACLSSSGTVRVLSSETKKVVKKLSLGRSAKTISINDDGTLLATAKMGSHAEVWDIDAGTILRRCPSPGYCNYADCAAFHPRQDWVLTGSIDALIRRWSIREPRRASTLKEDYRHYSMMAFSPDGALLAVADSHGLVRIIRLQDWVTVSKIESGIEDIWILFFSDDGRELTAYGSNDYARVWSIQSRGFFPFWRGKPLGTPKQIGAQKPSSSGISVLTMRMECSWLRKASPYVSVADGRGTLIAHRESGTVVAVTPARFEMSTSIPKLAIHPSGRAWAGLPQSKEQVCFFVLERGRMSNFLADRILPPDDVRAMIERERKAKQALEQFQERMLDTVRRANSR